MDRIKEIRRQTYQYFYVDGLPELVTGSMFTLTGLWLLAMHLVEAGTIWAALVALGLPLILIGGMFVLNKMLRRWKEHITFPRTGYVSYRRDQSDRKRWIIIGVGLLIPVILMFLPEAWGELPLVIGMILGVVLIYLGYRMGIRRFYALGAFAGILGIFAMLYMESEVLGSAVVFLGAGLAMIVSGGLHLVQYLRANPTHSEASG